MVPGAFRAPQLLVHVVLVGRAQDTCTRFLQSASVTRATETVGIAKAPLEDVAVHLAPQQEMLEGASLGARQHVGQAFPMPLKFFLGHHPQDVHRAPALTPRYFPERGAVTAGAKTVCMGAVGQNRLSALSGRSQHPPLVSQEQTTLGSGDEHAHGLAQSMERAQPLGHSRNVLHHGGVESSDHLCLDPNLWKASGLIVEQHSQVVFQAPLADVHATGISSKASQKSLPQLQRTNEQSRTGALFTPRPNEGQVEVRENRIVAHAAPFNRESVPTKPEVHVILDQHAIPTTETGGCDAALKHVAAEGQIMYC